MGSAGDENVDTARRSRVSELALALLDLRQAMTARHLLEDFAAHAGATLHESAVVALLIVRDAGPTRPSDLAGRLSMTMPAVSRTLNRLAADGLLERHIGRTDLRSVHFTTTPAGDELADAVWTRVVSSLEGFSAGWDDDEIAIITHRLCQLGDAVRASAGT